MQNLRARHDVYAAVGEGQVERITSDRTCALTERTPRQRWRQLESDGGDSDALRFGHSRNGGRDIAESCADIQHGDDISNRSSTKDGAHFADNRTATAKERIRKTHVSERSFGERRIVRRVVENLVSAPSRWGQHRRDMGLTFKLCIATAIVQQRARVVSCSRVHFADHDHMIAGRIARNDATFQ